MVSIRKVLLTVLIVPATFMPVLVFSFIFLTIPPSVGVQPPSFYDLIIALSGFMIFFQLVALIGGGVLIARVWKRT